MKKNLKTGLCVLAATAFLSTGGYFGIDYGKKWVNNKVNNAVTEAITQYEQNDKKWTEKTFGDGITQYDNQNKQWNNKNIEDKINQYGQKDKKATEQNIKKGINEYAEKDKQWTEKTFETKLPLEEIAKVFTNSYMIINWCNVTTITGQTLEAPIGTGSGILLKGGYFLTAKHVTDVDMSEQMNHPVYGPLKFDHSEFSLTTERPCENTQKTNTLEKITVGLTTDLDYTLLKLKEPANLPYYSKGVNMTKKFELGMPTIAIGFPLAFGRNIRIGNLSQIDSDMGKDYITYKNDVLPSDSGGPLFVIENGEIKLAAITTVGIQIPQGLGAQFVNLNYGLKMESIVKDLEDQLKSGKLDKQTAQEIETFLKLNKK